MPEKLTALIIDTPLVWDLMCALDPHFKELSYEENLGSYLVLNFDATARWAIVTPATFHTYFDNIENGKYIRTYEFTKK